MKTTLKNGSKPQSSAASDSKNSGEAHPAVNPMRAPRSREARVARLKRKLLNEYAPQKGGRP